MANPIVDKLFGEFSKALEGWFDRSRKAVDSARNGGYSFEQFAADVTQTWVDSTYVSFLPASLLGAVTVTPTLPFPTLRFRLANRNDITRLVAVPNLPSVTGMASENLLDASGANKIPTGNINPTKAAATFMSVALKNLGPLGIPAGLYTGNVIGQPMNAPIARIEVDLP